MSDAVKVFFASPNRRSTIERALFIFGDRREELLLDADEKRRFLFEFIGMTLDYINNYPRYFDKHCAMNIAAIGDQFISGLKNNPTAQENIEQVFSDCYRFIIECQLSSPGSLAPEALYALERVPNYTYESVASQIKYADKQMLINVMQHYIYHPRLVDLKDLPGIIDQSIKQHDAIEKSMAEREGRVQELADKISNYETAFNFVGLYAGFKSMRSAKVSERRINFTYLLLLGCLLLLPFGLKIILILQGSDYFRLDAAGLITLAGLEILLLYFFRVALQNFKSIKAQLLQIDLRMTLCQFVQSYAEYSKDVRANNSAVLDRFEQIVFSGIVNDESAIPSTFDGLDKVADVLSKIRR